MRLVAGHGPRQVAAGGGAVGEVRRLDRPIGVSGVVPAVVGDRARRNQPVRGVAPRVVLKSHGVID